MERTFLLELTLDEVIMLQELSSDVDCCSEWQDQIAGNLYSKAIQAYQKPEITKMEYEERMRSIAEGHPQWPKDAIVQEKLREMESAALRFYYAIGGDEK